MLTLADIPLSFQVGLALILGLLFGSFLNVVIYRVPRGLSVLFPGSACPSCGQSIQPWQNVPVLSWLALRGKSACCKTPISPRYPLVELLGGAIGVLIVLLRLNDPSLTVGRAALLFFSYLALGLGLIALTFIDLEFMILTDSLTFGGAALGILVTPLRHRLSVVEAVVSGVGGYLLIWLPFVWGYEKLRGVPGMGLGDAKLVALAGTWFGPFGVLFTLFGGAVQGTLAFVVTLLVGAKLREPSAVTLERLELQEALEAATPEEREAIEQAIKGDPLAREPDGTLATARMPFGPFLAMALLELLFFEDALQALVDRTLFLD